MVEATSKQTRRNILVVTAERVWPATTGGQARVAGLLSALGHEFEITLVGPPCDSDGRVAHHVALSSVFSRRRSDFLALTPRLGLAAFTAASRRTIASLNRTSNFDATLFTHSYLAAVCDAPRGPVIVDFPNIEWERQRSIAKARGKTLAAIPPWVEAAKALRWEKLVARKSNLVLAVNSAEKQILSQFAPKAMIVPNGMHVSRDFENSPHDGYVLITGSAGYEPNDHAVRWFVNHVWPKVLHTKPGAQLVLAGTRTRELFESLETRVPGLRVLGYVESLEQLYSGAAVTIGAVDHGGGTQLKVVQAVGRRRVLVCNPYSMMSVPTAAKEFCIVASDAEAFASGVLRALRDVDWRHSVENQLDALASDLSWGTIGGQLSAEILRLIQTKHGAA